MKPDHVKEQAENERDEQCEEGADCHVRDGHIESAYVPRILRDRLGKAEKELQQQRTIRANEPETGMAEEPIDAKMERLERQNAKVQVIDMILSYRNKATDDERLRQIRVVVE